MLSVQAWILELLLGTGLLFWGIKKLPWLLARFPLQPLTATQPLPEDNPEVAHGSLIGGIVSVIIVSLAGYYGWPLSAPVGFLAFCGLPILGGLSQYHLFRMQPLAWGHPWRTLVDELAHQAGLEPVTVVLIQSPLASVEARGRSVVLTTCAVRRFPAEELRFLVALALWKVRGGKGQSDLADQFALSLTRDLKVAQSALEGLVKHQNSPHPVLIEQQAQRIERLTSWWQRQQVPILRTPPPQLQKQGLS